MPVLNANVLTAPGGYVGVKSDGVLPIAAATFNATYMIVDSTAGADRIRIPTQVTSAEDFENIFGRSGSLNSVKMHFANLPNAILYIVKLSQSDGVSGLTLGDFINAIQNSFNEEMPAGFLICPEAFQTLTTQADRTAVATALENEAAELNWFAIADSGPPAIINTTPEARTEALLYTTPQGHLAYYFPYLEDLDDNLVPPSAAVTAIAIRRYQLEGFNQPPAGTRFAVRGVKDVAVRVTKAQQAVLNPLGINVIRNLFNQGVVVWGSRTRSADPFWRFMHTRIIVNVVALTLKTAFDSLVFSVVDGKGLLYARIRETAEAMLYTLWDGGALAGSTPAQGFAVICDDSVNLPAELEQGIVRLQIYVAPVAVAERILIEVTRVSIGAVQVSANRAA